MTLPETTALLTQQATDYANIVSACVVSGTSTFPSYINTEDCISISSAKHGVRWNLDMGYQ